MLRNRPTRLLCTQELKAQKDKSHARSCRQNEACTNKANHCPSPWAICSSSSSKPDGIILESNQQIKVYNQWNFCIDWLKDCPGVAIRNSKTMELLRCQPRSKIQEILPPDKWKHASSQDNPADCASRAISLQQLKNADLWWRGPNWLAYPTTKWPKVPVVRRKNMPEKKEELRWLPRNKSESISHWSEPFLKFQQLS